jgi:uncharacterized protein (DUF433 family)
MALETSYVREESGTLYIGATQVTVYSLVAAWRNEGYSAEELQVGFPALSLAQVYGTIAYYLDHQLELDARFTAEDQDYSRQRTQDWDANPDFYRRLDERRAALRKRLGATNVSMSTQYSGNDEAHEAHGDD